MRSFLPPSLPQPLIIGGSFVLFALLLLGRRPDAVSRPQFWAEEATIFYSTAYAEPAITTIFRPAHGYFDLLLRGVAEASTFLPLERVPLLFSVFALLLHALVPTFLVSTRCRAWLGPLPVCVGIAVLYCLLPNSFEVHIMMLHARIHLALLSALILVSTKPTGRTGFIFDFSVLSLSVFSGPFALFLLPLAAWRFWTKRAADSSAVAYAAIITVGAAGALFALAASGSARAGLNLGASLDGLVKIIGGQFFLSFLFGRAGYERFLQLHSFPLLALLGFAALCFLIGILLWRSSGERRLLLLFGFGLLAVSLLSPLAAVDRPQWLALWSVPGCGQRYYFPAMAVLLLSLGAAVAKAKAPLSRVSASLTLLLLALFGARSDFRIAALPDLNFHEYAARFAAAEAGTSVSIPVQPLGWSLELRKKQSP